MKISDLQPIVDALVACREKHRLTQEEMGAELGISRKTYHLFESSAWLPPDRERAHFVKRLYDLDPAAAQTFVGVLGETLEQYVLALPSPGPRAAPLDPKHAKLAFDAALYATAEAFEMSPKALRPMAAELLARLAESGVTLAQAAALAWQAASAPSTR